MSFTKEMSAKEVVAQLHDGMTLGIGGWGPRRKPMALVREILRSDLKDLTLAAGYGGPEVGMLCAAGKVKKLIFAFVSLDKIPVEPFFRLARQSGKLEVSEMDEGMFQLGLRAAAMRLPFLPTRVGLGTDVMKVNPEFKTITSPYQDGEVLLAMPAIKLDAALLHVNLADRLGNTQIHSPDPFFDEHFARAADACYVSCEQLEDRLDKSHSETAKLNYFERFLVTGVVHAPAGAHPTLCGPDYGWDMQHLKHYASLAGEENGWETYSKEFLSGNDEAAYQSAVGGAAQITSLPLPVF